MAYLNKEQYEYRQRMAGERSYQNQQTAQENGMSENEASLIAELCRVRHDIHSNMLGLAKSGGEELNELLRVKDDINATNLPKLSFGRFDAPDYIDIDSIDLLYEIEDVPDDDDERKEWIDDNTERIVKEISELNTIIENYLREIDEKYNTSFAPTGALRIF